MIIINTNNSNKYLIHKINNKMIIFLIIILKKNKYYQINNSFNRNYRIKLHNKLKVFY